eukprot:TRINITY_DN15346_c0_g1_i1.p1 TRINITY_DN15346_c0_g1~~TRINITY_DN15346_c0_g1_i1.p1  ORF type:complete len:111 (+),score=29.67 TRINITY_DN15346_c0_g1_i1:175-507(+)
MESIKRSCSQMLLMFANMSKNDSKNQPEEEANKALDELSDNSNKDGTCCLVLNMEDVNDYEFVKVINSGKGVYARSLLVRKKQDESLYLMKIDSPPMTITKVAKPELYSS